MQCQRRPQLTRWSSETRDVAFQSCPAARDEGAREPLTHPSLGAMNLGQAAFFTQGSSQRGLTGEAVSCRGMVVSTGSVHYPSLLTKLARL